MFKILENVEDDDEAEKLLVNVEDTDKNDVERLIKWRRR